MQNTEKIKMLEKDDMALKAPSSPGTVWLILWFQDDMPANTAGLPIQKALRVVKVHLWAPDPLTQGLLLRCT